MAHLVTMAITVLKQTHALQESVMEAIQSHVQLTLVSLTLVTLAVAHALQLQSTMKVLALMEMLAQQEITVPLESANLEQAPRVPL